MQFHRFSIHRRLPGLGNIGLHKSFSIRFLGFDLPAGRRAVCFDPPFDFGDDVRVLGGDIVSLADVFCQVVELPGGISFLLNGLEFAHSDGLH